MSRKDKEESIEIEFVPNEAYDRSHAVRPSLPSDKAQDSGLTCAFFVPTNAKSTHL
jgi:hypothetical protein